MEDLAGGGVTMVTDEAHGKPTSDQPGNPPELLENSVMSEEPEQRAGGKRGRGEKEADEPQAKRRKSLEQQESSSATSCPTESQSVAPDAAGQSAPSPVKTRATTAAAAAAAVEPKADSCQAKPASSTAQSNPTNSQQRWRVHQMAEDYLAFVSDMILFPTNQLGPYGFGEVPQNGKSNNGPSRQRCYPLELVSSLGYLKSPLRRPTVVERWSPYEIALFEGGMGHYGKDFYRIHKLIETKSTKEVIDFYYIWKKTKHYKVWKKNYVTPADLLNDDDEAVGTPAKKPSTNTTTSRR